MFFDDVYSGDTICRGCGLVISSHILVDFLWQDSLGDVREEGWEGSKMYWKYWERWGCKSKADKVAGMMICHKLLYVEKGMDARELQREYKVGEAELAKSKARIRGIIAGGDKMAGMRELSERLNKEMGVNVKISRVERNIEGIRTRSPYTIIGAVYGVETKELKKVARILKVSESSIRSCMKHIK